MVSQPVLDRAPRATAPTPGEGPSHAHLPLNSMPSTAAQAGSRGRSESLVVSKSAGTTNRPVQKHPATTAHKLELLRGSLERGGNGRRVRAKAKQVAPSVAYEPGPPQDHGPAVSRSCWLGPRRAEAIDAPGQPRLMLLIGPVRERARPLGDHHFADNSRHSSAWVANSYQHPDPRRWAPHAIRIVARVWVQVLRDMLALWVYDPASTRVRSRPDRFDLGNSRVQVRSSQVAASAEVAAVRVATRRGANGRRLQATTRVEPPVRRLAHGRMNQARPGSRGTRGMAGSPDPDIQQSRPVSDRRHGIACTPLADREDRGGLNAAGTKGGESGGRFDVRPRDRDAWRLGILTDAWHPIG